MYVDSKYATKELVKGVIENVPDKYMEIFRRADKFYDLHIDSLNFLDYDFDWAKYFTYFPKPNVPINKQDYLVFHLRSNGEQNKNNLDRWYISNLLNYASEKYLCKVIIASQHEEFFEKVKSKLHNPQQVEFIVADIPTICDIICNAKGMYSIDSGFKYLALGARVPLVYSSMYCNTPFNIPEYQQIRWHPIPNIIFPVMWNYKEIINHLDKMIDNSVYGLFPRISNFDQLIKKKYTINIDSIL